MDAALVAMFASGIISFLVCLKLPCRDLKAGTAAYDLPWTWQERVQFLTACAWFPLICVAGLGYVEDAGGMGAFIFAIVVGFLVLFGIAIAARG